MAKKNGLDRALTIDDQSQNAYCYQNEFKVL